ncbi:MAG TPA: branched-chain amino acid ABC transporter permease [Methylomirabilota bacterium]|nr:branched-chain amino acid ABC transporter permease [Methylomirabilota bacterium]
MDQFLEDLTRNAVSVLASGIFHASILFLVSAGLQVVFGVQKIFNLACGSFYALGAYVGVSAVQAYAAAGGPPGFFIVPLALAGLAVGLVGVVVERGLLRFVYERDETFQLLLTFALVLMLEDAIRLTWGTSPLSTGGMYLVYGQVRILGAAVPVYNLVVIAASLAIAIGIGALLTRTAFGRIIRAAADNREMAEALGVDMRRLYARVFTLGTALGTLGGALVIPATAAMSEMGIELIVEAFAVVVIGGLGSMRGAFVGALVVGVLRSVAISIYPELEMLLIYLIVIAVLVLRPRGLFGTAATAT